MNSNTGNATDENELASGEVKTAFNSQGAACPLFERVD
jgi:hypothetical protein